MYLIFNNNNNNNALNFCNDNNTLYKFFLLL